MLPHEELLEIGKFLLDLFKQLIALDTAMLAAIVTIVEKVFKTERVLKSNIGKGFLGLSLIFFVCSLILSVFALQEIINNLSQMLQGITMNKWVSDFLFFGSNISFVLGILLFLCLAVWSFLSSSTPRNQNASKAKNTKKSK
jgi:hypothetical protein